MQGKDASDAERAARLARMRSKTSRNDRDASSMPMVEQDVATLVRTRLMPDELLELRTVGAVSAQFSALKYSILHHLSCV